MRCCGDGLIWFNLGYFTLGEGVGGNPVGTWRWGRGGSVFTTEGTGHGGGGFEGLCSRCALWFLKQRSFMDMTQFPTGAE
jgi:hypothetical protein